MTDDHPNSADRYTIEIATIDLGGGVDITRIILHDRTTGQACDIPDPAATQLLHLITSQQEPG